MPGAVTVALPVRDGGALLEEVLAAVAAQDVDRDVELLVCDSGSRDGSAETAQRLGARVLRIPPAAFGHGRTRNLLAAEARGEHVAFLTQDATPASERWLQALLDAFGAGRRVALVSGPYLPRPGAPVPLRRELADFFARIPPLTPPGTTGLSPATFHSDANGAVLKAAWAQVPFRDVAYAEDQLLALDLLAAGWSKAFARDAAVVHSHDYTRTEQARRWFDEFRALREVHGHVAPLHPRRVTGEVRAQVRADRAAGAGRLESLGYHGPRAVMAALGTRADRLPAPLRRRLSLEGRASFVPLDRPS